MQQKFKEARQNGVRYAVYQQVLCEHMHASFVREEQSRLGFTTF